MPSLDDLYNQHLARIDELFDAVRYLLGDSEDKLQGLRNRLQRVGLDKQVRQRMEVLSWKRQRLLQLAAGRIQESRQHLELLRQKLATLDPKGVLQRGYAVVKNEEGEILRSHSQLNVGDELFVVLASGGVKVRVVEIKE